MRKSKTGKKPVGAVVAVICALAIVLTGTWAWRDIDQMAANQFNAINYEAELVDVFTPPTDWEPGQEINKDVSVKNTGNGKIFVRVNFKEIFDYLTSSTAETQHMPGAWNADPMDCACPAHEMITWVMGDGVIKDASEFAGPEDAWFYDATTGWFYWGNPLEPGEETAKILDAVKMNDDAALEGDLEYIINVYMHAFSANEQGVTDFETTMTEDGQVVTSDVDDIVMQIVDKALPRILINEANFPDPVFRAAVAKYDTNKDGRLNPDEIREVKKLDFLGKNSLKDVTGLQYFTELETLWLQGNPLTNVDPDELLATVNTLKKMKNFQTGGDVAFTELHLELPELERIWIRPKTITSVDITKCPNLQRLDVTVTPAVATIDLSQNPKLWEVVIHGTVANQPFELDVTNQPELKMFAFNNMAIPELDLRNNLKLEDLYLYSPVSKFCTVTWADEYRFMKNYQMHNGGTATNPTIYEGISKMPNLISLSAGSAGITSIDLSKHSKLESLNLKTNNIEQIDLSGCPNLKNLYLDGNKLTEIDVSSNPLLVNFTYASQKAPGTNPPNLIGWPKG